MIRRLSQVPTGRPAVALFALYLVVQALFVAAMYLNRPSGLGWQMFSTVPAPAYEVLGRDGTTRLLSAREVRSTLGARRSSVYYGHTIPDELCERFKATGVVRFHQGRTQGELEHTGRREEFIC